MIRRPKTPLRAAEEEIAFDIQQRMWFRILSQKTVTGSLRA